MKKVHDYVKANGAMFIATCDGDKPRVRPFGSMMEYEGRLYMCMGDYKESYKQLRANPNMEFCTLGADGSFLRVRAVAVFDERPEAVEAFYEHDPGLLDLYRNQGLNLAVFYLTEGYAEIQGGEAGFEKWNF